MADGERNGLMLEKKEKNNGDEMICRKEELLKEVEDGAKIS